MTNLLQIYFDVFWQQLPLGTELTWTHALRQSNEIRVYIASLAVLFTSFYMQFIDYCVITIPYHAWNTRSTFKHSVPSALGFRSTLYTVASILASSCFILLSFPVIAFSLTLLIALPTLGFVFLVVWALNLLLLFLAWFVIWRYPVYELFYPRLRQWILTHNSKVYSPLPESTETIRVVRLKKGRTDQPIKCDLLVAPVSEARYEALSYVWGTSLVPYRISVNEKPFYVTHNLFKALKYLRHPDQDRVIWIDALCINQFDNAEKSDQVQMMQTIYAKAAKVTVWLGEAKKTTKRFFEIIHQYSGVSPEEEEVWCDNFISSPENKQTWSVFRSIAEHQWWSRAWIIQEVVMGSHVVIQTGSQHVDWDVFVKFATSEICRDSCPDTMPLFVNSIKELRSDVEATSTTLMDLAYRFRTQSATFGSDKLYALLGLVRLGGHAIFKPDYTKSPAEVFLDFTVSCLENHQLSIITLAAGAELEGTSWCRDWRSLRDGMFSPLPLSITQPGSVYTPKDFCASNGHGIEFKVDLPRRILSLRGFEVDTVLRTGRHLDADRIHLLDLESSLVGWQSIAGGPWNDNPSLQAAFNRTITADSWTNEPQDWTQYIQSGGTTARTETAEAYRACLNEVATHRCFFVTREGRFGLGPWNMKKDDKVCILLGGKTPFVLRPYKPPRQGPERTGRYKVIGEAYVDGLMYYPSNIEDDVRNGTVLLTWFNLL